MGYPATTGVGLRLVYVAPRDEDGAIAVPATQAVATAYNGVRAGRSRALTITPATPQQITARGDDVTYHVFLESPTEVPSGELRTQESDSDLIALISGVRSVAYGNMTMTPINTDMLGQEPGIIVWGCRQAIDSKYGSASNGYRVWETYIIPNAKAYVQPPTMEDSTVGETVYTVVANMTSVDFLGRTLTQAVWGCLQLGFVMLKTEFKVMLNAFIGNDTEDEFVLSEGANSKGDEDFIVTVDGENAAATIVAGVLTFASPPADGAKIAIMYQYE
jgi:hypothetical protein